MTDTSLRISDLTVSATISDTDIFEIERGGAAYSVTRALVKGGDVSSSTSSVTDGAVVAFDGTGGKTIKAATTIVATSCSGNSATSTLAGKSTNIVGGAAGSVPYQSALDTTVMLALGTAGQILRVNSGATAPEYVTAPYVGLSGSESVSGVKTFSSFPITPSSAPTTDYQMANKKYVDDNAESATFSSSANGYLQLSCGFILQWGYESGIAASSSRTVSFPMTFPTANLWGMAGIGEGTSINGVNAFYFNKSSTSQFTLVSEPYVYTGTANAYWLAIGY